MFSLIAHHVDIDCYGTEQVDGSTVAPFVSNENWCLYSDDGACNALPRESGCGTCASEGEACAALAQE